MYVFYKCKINGDKMLYLGRNSIILNIGLPFLLTLLKNSPYYVKYTKEICRANLLLLCILVSYGVVNTPLPYYCCCYLCKLFWS